MLVRARGRVKRVEVMKPRPPAKPPDAGEKMTGVLSATEFCFHGVGNSVGERVGS